MSIPKNARRALGLAASVIVTTPTFGCTQDPLVAVDAARPAGDASVPLDALASADAGMSRDARTPVDAQTEVDARVAEVDARIAEVDAETPIDAFVEPPDAYRQDAYYYPDGVRG